MSQTSIGKASLIITTDASGARQGLDKFGADARASMDRVAANTRAGADKASAEVERGFEHTQSKLNKAMGKFAKHEGGFAGMLGVGLIGDLAPQLAVPAAVLTGVVLLAKQFGDEIGKWVFGIESTEKMLEKVREHFAEVTEQEGLATKRAEEFIAAAGDRRTRGELLGMRIEELKGKRFELEKLVAAQKLWEQSQRFIDRLSPDKSNRPEEWMRISTIDETIKGNQKQLKDYDRQLEDLGIRHKRALDPTQDPAFIGKIAAATHALKDQIVTWGLVGTAAQRALLVEEGAVDEMLIAFDRHAAEVKRLTELNSRPPAWMQMGLDMTLKAAEMAKPLVEEMERIRQRSIEGTKSLMDYVHGQERAARAIGLTADQAALLEAKLAGSNIFMRAAAAQRLHAADLLANSNGRIFNLMTGGAFNLLGPILEMVKKAKGGHELATDNAALIKGSSAEVQARLRYESGQHSATEVIATRVGRSNDLLTQVLQAVSPIAGALAGAAKIVPM